MGNFKDFNSKLEGIALLIGILSKNLEILNKVSRFHDHYEELTSKYEKLKALNGRYNKDIDLLLKTRDERRNALIDNTTTVVRVLQAFATDHKKKNLQFRLEQLTPEFFHDCSDLELIKISKKAWLIANQHGGYATTFVNKIKSALNPENLNANYKFEKKYGLIPEMIKNIEDTTLSFIDAMLQLQNAVKEKELVADEMKTIFKQSKKLLTNKIDKFALLFENKNPKFYKEYSQAREKQIIKHIAEIIEQDIEFQDQNIVESAEKPTEVKSKRKVVPIVEES
ncbi:MAG: hypothetical protein WCJ95_07400 [Mariniphaga sp.]